MFGQISKDVEDLYRDITGFDMSYEQFQEFCRAAWKDEEYNYLYIHRSEKKSEGKFCICYESKNTFIECIPETNSSYNRIYK